MAFSVRSSPALGIPLDAFAKPSPLTPCCVSMVSVTLTVLQLGQQVPSFPLLLGSCILAHIFAWVRVSASLFVSQ